jgi:hypothetical protein
MTMGYYFVGSRHISPDGPRLPPDPRGAGRGTTMMCWAN